MCIILNEIVCRILTLVIDVAGHKLLNVKFQEVRCPFTQFFSCSSLLSPFTIDRAVGATRVLYLEV